MTTSPSVSRQRGVQSFVEQHGDWWAPSIATEAARLAPLLKKARLSTNAGAIKAALYRLRKAHPILERVVSAPTPALSPLAPVEQASDAQILEDIGVAHARLAELGAQLKTYTDETTALLDRLRAETEARRARLEQLRLVINNGAVHA